MRAALWLLVLFAIAVAVALFAGNNQGSITVFWPPYRVDLSLNLVLLLLVAAFLLLHAALRALPWKIEAVSDEFIAEQQEAADIFHRTGFIDRPVEVATARARVTGSAGTKAV